MNSLEGNKNRKILITSYYYEPENTPRAFRTKELVKELSKRNYSIDLFIPEENSKRINKHLQNVRVIGVDSNKKKMSMKQHISNDVYGFSARIKEKILNTTTGDINGFTFGSNLYKALMKKAAHENYDAIISIGLPFYTHLATARFIRKTKQSSVNICEYGDPFYYNPQHAMPFFIKYIEKWSANQFDYICIPTIKALDYFVHLKKKEDIKIIPQGFDFSEISISKYSTRDVPVFCYAGIFYKKIRNPQSFFEMLMKVNAPFKFVIYTDLNDRFSNEICSHFKSVLGDRLVVNNFIPRVELIKKISEMDFLINFENANSNQVPSKLIDYALSGRPILNIDPTCNNAKEFLNFLGKDYSNQVKIDIASYDIRNVANSFEKLITS